MVRDFIPSYYEQIFVWAVDSQFLLYEANIGYREPLLCCFLEDVMAYDIFRIFVDEILEYHYDQTRISQ